jgi:iron(II)-dependent oxidoreductase
VDDDPYGMGTQFDDTELPQHRVWLDAYEIDRDEINLGEYLSYLFAHKLHPSKDLQHLIWHVITVHSVTDETLAQWPALYVTWKEADSLCRSLGKRLPTEAEWEKAARGPDGNRFPWGDTLPDSSLAMFGQHHVHEIPDSGACEQRRGGEKLLRSPSHGRQCRRMGQRLVRVRLLRLHAGTQSARTDQRPVQEPARRVLEKPADHARTATRSGAPADQRSATVGFRCAKSVPPPARDNRPRLPKTFSTSTSPPQPDIPAQTAGTRHTRAAASQTV